MRKETLTKMQEAPDNEVHDVYGEVHEAYDDLRGVEGKLEQAFNESHDKLYETQEAAAVAKRTVGATNAIGVGKRRRFSLIQIFSINRLLMK